MSARPWSLRGFRKPPLQLLVPVGILGLGCVTLISTSDFLWFSVPCVCVTNFPQSFFLWGHLSLDLELRFRNITSQDPLHLQSTTHLPFFQIKSHSQVSGVMTWTCFFFLVLLFNSLVFPDGSVVKNAPASAADKGDVGSIPGSGRSWEEERATHSSILAWKIPWQRSLASCSPVAKSRTWLSSWEHSTYYIYIPQYHSIRSRINKNRRLRLLASLIAQLVKNPLEKG